MTIFVCHLGAKHYNNWLENDVLTQLGGDKVDTHTLQRPTTLCTQLQSNYSVNTGFERAIHQDETAPDLAQFAWLTVPPLSLSVINSLKLSR